MLETEAGMTVSTDAVVVPCRASLSYISVGMTMALLLTLNTFDSSFIVMLMTISIVTFCVDLLSFVGLMLNS